LDTPLVPIGTRTMGRIPILVTRSRFSIPVMRPKMGELPRQGFESALRAWLDIVGAYTLQSAAHTPPRKQRQPARTAIDTTFASALPPSRAPFSSHPQSSMARTCSGQRLDRRYTPARHHGSPPAGGSAPHRRPPPVCWPPQGSGERPAEIVPRLTVKRCAAIAWLGRRDHRDLDIGEPVDLTPGAAALKHQPGPGTHPAPGCGRP
jgi:hypothetical protein